MRITGHIGDFTGPGDDWRLLIRLDNGEIYKADISAVPAVQQQIRDCHFDLTMTGTPCRISGTGQIEPGGRIATLVVLSVDEIGPPADGD